MTDTEGEVIRRTAEKRGFVEEEIHTLREIWRYRMVISSLIRKDMMGRYGNTVLGLKWHFIMPFMIVGVLCLVFTTLRTSDMENYWLYICSGMFPLYFLSACMNGRAFGNNRKLIKKTHFPLEIASIADVSANMLNFLVSYLIVIILAANYVPREIGIAEITNLLLSPLSIALLFLFGLGVSKIVTTITIVQTDAGHLISILGRLLVWVTPTIFTLAEASDMLYTVAVLNPFTYYVEMFHDIVYYDAFFAEEYILSAAVAVIVWLFGTWLFNRYKYRFVEMIA